MANLIEVNSFTGLDLNNETPASAATAMLINPAKIVSVETLATAIETTGITSIVYEGKINSQDYQFNLIVEETQAAVLAAANAPLA